MQMLAYPDHTARRWEPKRLRFRLLTAAGVLARSARRNTLHLSPNGWSDIILNGLANLGALAVPG